MTILLSFKERQHIKQLILKNVEEKYEGIQGTLSNDFAEYEID